MYDDHSPRFTEDEPPWILCLARKAPTRLVVFVHGFRGRATKTWREFERSGIAGEWWKQSDLLFVGYDSIHDGIEAVAIELRERLPEFYPQPPASLLDAGGERARNERGCYRELYLVGHSLGGVVIRRMMCDSAQIWKEGATTQEAEVMPAPLNAVVRLFSPASAGFRAAGPLGMLHASLGWVGVEIYLRRSSAYTDIKKDSDFLKTTKERTEMLVGSNEPALATLKAHIVWASREQVVIAERYHTDYVASQAKGQDHKSVCKPTTAYPLPWRFVETGKTHKTNSGTA